MSHQYSPQQILPILERVWFVGPSAKEIVMTLPDELEIEEHRDLVISNEMPKEFSSAESFGRPLTLSAVSSLALHPNLQIELKRRNVWAVIACHEPLLIDGSRYVIGFDLNPTGPSGLFGRMDFWNIDASLRWNFFPRPKTGEFLFATSAP